jgi:hypothetical protein
MEVVTLVGVLWCVYLSEIVWWTTDDHLILTGRRSGTFKGQYGPSLHLRDRQGFLAPSLVPPFAVLFECRLGGRSDTRPAARSLVERSVARALTATVPLRQLGAGLWLYVFIVAPAVIVFFGLRRTWQPLVAVLAMWLLAIILTYRRSWTKLYPDRPGGWRNDAVLMALSPLGAIRAADRLSRNALADLSAMRVASVIASQDEFCRLARLVYFDIDARHDARQEIDRILEAERWAGIFVAPPAAESGMKGFCPRCHTQLLRDAGECPDCVGVLIRSFA